MINNKLLKINNNYNLKKAMNKYLKKFNIKIKYLKKKIKKKIKLLKILLFI